MPRRRGPRGPQLPQAGITSSAPAVASPASVSPSPENLPELVVEWMPASSPTTTDGTWAALTPYVTKWSTKRGRQYELDQFGAGQASITLETFDRTYDPENTAGTYYGQLKPMRQVRIRLKWQGVFYPVFRGYVTSWGQTVEQDKKFVTTVSVRDGFERLEQIRLPSSAWALEIAKDSPSAWFRLGESGTVRVTDSTSNGNYGVYDNCQQGQSSLVVNDSDAAASFAHSLEERIVIQNPSLITGYPFTFSCMLQVDSSDPAGQKTIFTGLATNTASASCVVVLLNSSGGTPVPGTVRVQIIDAVGGNAATYSSVRVDDDVPHHLAVVVPSTDKATWAIYVDGVNVTTGAAGVNPTWPGQPPNGWVVGNYIDLVSGDYGFGANADGLGAASQEVHRGTIDEVCVWNGTAVDSTRIAAHALAAKSGWDDDLTGARVARFLDRIGWPSDLREIDTGASTLGPANWSAGGSALSVLQGWADTESGAFFIGRDGKLVWHSRHYPFLDFNALRSRATFADAHWVVRVTDSFNRTNSASTLGTTDSVAGGANTAWTVQTGTWGISNNTAYEPGATAQATAVVQTSLADCYVEATLTVAGDAGLCWRSSDDNNYWMMNATGGLIYKRVAGAFTAVETFTAAVDGDVMRVVLSGDTHTVYKNGVLAKAFTDSFNNTATKHGFRSFSTSATRFDNFRVVALTTSGQILATDIDPVRDATLIRNPVTASRKNGVSVTVRDDNLADNTYGDRTWASPTTEDRADATVRDRATWLLARYKNESLRLASMVVHPRLQPTLWATILGLEIGHRVTLNRTPLGQGSQLTPDQILERIDWTGDGFDIHVEFGGSPVDPGVGTYLILDDATAGVLDTAAMGY